MAAVKWARLLWVFLLFACAGTESRSGNATGGALVISTGGDPDILVPPLLSSVQAAQIVDLVYDRLAVIGDSLSIVNDAGFGPQLADRWTWSPDSLSIAFHINPRARWHDGKPVRSSDVRFTFQSTTDSTLGSGVRALVSNIDSVTTPDSTTAVFWFRARSPQQFYDATFQMPVMPEHIWRGIAPSSWRGSAPAKHPIGSGQYRFVRWVPLAVVELAADTGNYRGPPRLSRVIWSIAPNFNTAVTRFFAGETDFFEQLRPENLAEVAKHPELRTKQYRGLSYVFAQFNLHDPANVTRPHPIFGNRELRRALTMATDRTTLVRSVYDSLALPALGPTVRAYPTTDPNLAQIPFDLPRARQLLDSLGWRDANGDGIRERNGRPLQFSIAVPGTSSARVRLAVLLQEQLRQAGVKVEVEQMDFPVLIERLRKRSFDTTIGQWNTQPSPGSVRGSWGTVGSRSTSGTNYSSYESPVFDAYVDSALASFDQSARRAYFTKAYETIIQDAPAIWLAELIPTVGYHSRLQLAPLRSDAWWAHVSEWWIPADKRIPRDDASGPTSTAPAESAGKKAR
jgi:peptide/nickel transport system substrate-binding protein